ncbi:NADP-dependent oxidoreductase [Cupriavidus sp. NPDC089707]|uniref:NADP-dependent oxidoreductase n=1 Tax=Cupriavidus sp. NPDC089707 TaxID=3363963 RepID=UPI003806F84F
MARAWYLKSRPAGMPSLDNFALRPAELAPLTSGTVRVRNRWLSVDPYMRGRMNDVESYVPPFALDAPLDGAAIGEVLESKAEGLVPGDLVSHRFGWRDELVAPAQAFVKLSHGGVPPQAYLNTLGMIGATAYFGLLAVAAAKPGETLFVSAAAGAVGSTVVQIARLMGMTVVASAGGPEKCAYVKSLGADAVIDYKAPGDLQEKLAAAATKGIDVYFDNVGGDHLDAALGVARQGARVAVCGMIDMYNGTETVALRNLFRVISHRIRIEGFIVSDFSHRLDEFRAAMGRWVANGDVVGRETVMDGLECAPEAFLALFSGRNLGKMLVRLP